MANEIAYKSEPGLKTGYRLASHKRVIIDNVGNRFENRHVVQLVPPTEDWRKARVYSIHLTPEQMRRWPCQPSVTWVVAMNDRAVESYIAKRYAEKYVNGKRRRVLESLIPNLLFVYTTKEKAEEYVKGTPALSYITYYYNHFELDDNQKNPPLTVSCAEMDNFMLATASMNEHLMFVQPSQCHFRSGELVKVIEGPFTGVEGRVARVAGQQRVILTLSEVGLISTAYVPTAFIRKIEQ